MKRIVLLFCLTFSIVSKAQTSVYHPFPAGPATWNEAWFSYGWWQGGTNLYTTTGADTLIDTTSYMQFFQNGMYYGGYREDMVNRKVYFMPKHDMQGYPPGVEFLWFDFSLNAGDTSQAFPLDYCPTVEDMTVTSVDSVLVGTTYRKRLYFEAAGFEGEGGTYIIEGIGSLGGVFSGSCFEAESRVCTFEYDGNTFENWGSPCNVGLGERNGVQLVVFPNPTSGTVFLKGVDLVEGDMIRITNASGQLVAERSLTITEGLARIDVSGIQSGLYLLKVGDKVARIAIAD